MSKISDAPFAITSEGRVVLNVTHTDGDLEITSLLERASALDGRVFIGVELDRTETKFVVERIGNAAAEVAALVAGARAARE